MQHGAKYIVLIKLTISASDSKTQSLIYENGHVLKKEYADDKVYIEAEVPLRIKEMLDKIS